MRESSLRRINNIDYYCFSTKTGDISVFTDLDQYANWREKRYYTSTREDVFLAKEKGKLLLFDLRNNTFVNENGECVDISNKVIFPRSTIGDSILLLEKIEEAKGKSITSKEDDKIVKYWFDIVKPKRELMQTTYGEVKSNLDKYQQLYGKTFFLKTIEKGFSDVCIIFECANSKFLVDSSFHSVNLSINNPETPVLVCKAVKVLVDEFAKREWRAFVVNNEFLSLSRFSDNIVPIEEYVYDKVKEKIREFEGIMPSSYVVDFFEYTDDNEETIFDISEFNPIIASGTFRNNDLVF